MPGKILCVAEKPSIAKAVAGHLSGGQYQTVSRTCTSYACSVSRLKSLIQSNTGNTYIKNYSFTFDFGPPWGNCNVVMTCVSGHLTELTFGPDYNDWSYPPPERLFDAPVRTTIDQVCGSDQALTWS